jgi:hypothetical protein
MTVDFISPFLFSEYIFPLTNYAIKTFWREPTILIVKPTATAVYHFLFS